MLYHVTARGNERRNIFLGNGDDDRAERDRAIAAAYRTGAYSMQAIAEHFNIGRMTVSRAAKHHETE